MDSVNYNGHDSHHVNPQSWIFEESDTKDYMFPKNLPPIEKISQFLQCCRCSDFVSLLLHPKGNSICLNSHSICHSCLLEVETCQFQYSNGNKCSTPFVNMPQGHMNIFNFLRYESHVYCPYWISGCKEIVVGRSLEFHLEKECAFRPLSTCMFTDCSVKKIVMSDLVNHIEYDHKVKVDVEKTFKIQIEFKPEEFFKTEDKGSVLALLECFNSHFIVVMQETPEKYFVWTLQCPFVDPAIVSPRREFISQVQLFDRFTFVSKTIRKLAEVWETPELRRFWSFPVHSIYRPVDEIIHLGECFEISKQIFMANSNYYLGRRKDGTQFWSMEIAIQVRGLS